MSFKFQISKQQVLERQHLELIDCARNRLSSRTMPVVSKFVTTDKLCQTPNIVVVQQIRAEPRPGVEGGKQSNGVLYWLLWWCFSPVTDVSNLWQVDFTSSAQILSGLCKGLEVGWPAFRATRDCFVLPCMKESWLQRLSGHRPGGRTCFLEVPALELRNYPQEPQRLQNTVRQPS